MITRLPEPTFNGRISLEKCLSGRRSIRTFSDTSVSLQHLSQILWAAQGITSPYGYRTAPSAGALYPLELYAIIGSVENLPIGVYQYKPAGHELRQKIDTDIRQQLTRAAFGQNAILKSAVSLAISAIYKRTTSKYGQRGIRYVHMDAGHAAQNICLQAYALDLGTVPIGAFQDEEVRRIMQLQNDETPLYILPVGNY